MFEGKQQGGDNPLSPTPQSQTKRLWRFVGIFVGIIIIVAGIHYVWEYYLSPSARGRIDASTMQKNYEQFAQQKAQYEEAMRNDTYGGKTPEETLSLFVSALEKGDADLASKYFLIGEKITQEEWRTGIQKMKDTAQLEFIINDIKSAKLLERSEMLNYAIFRTTNKESEPHDISLKLNTYSNIWKIESL